MLYFYLRNELICVDAVSSADKKSHSEQRPHPQNVHIGSSVLVGLAAQKNLSGETLH